MKAPVLTQYHVKTEYPINGAIRIAHVSDLHERRAGDVLALLREVSPDLIVITGDTFERYDNRPQYDFEHRPVKRAIVSAIHYTNFLLMLLQPPRFKADDENVHSFLSGAVRIAPVYMSLGNHEQLLLDEDFRFLSEQGVHLLDNADTAVTVKGLTLHIGGMSTWDYEPFLDAFAAKDGFKLLLCHHPERFEPFIRDTDIDLTLSGHTHGGQFAVGKRAGAFLFPGRACSESWRTGAFSAAG